MKTTMITTTMTRGNQSIINQPSPNELTNPTMDKYKNKYRIASTRLQHWDYRWAGAYFITICTQNREHYFGEIINGKMQLSQVGVIADILWHQIPYHAKNIELGEFVVMPNHTHGIIIINDNADNDNADNDNADNDNVDDDNVDDDNVDNDNVETGHALSLQPPTPPPTIGQQRFQNIGENSISSVVGSYKSAVTKHANRLQYDFQWQSRFHDHIIRDDQSFQKISEYIINNPTNWQDDKFHNSKK